MNRPFTRLAALAFLGALAVLAPSAARAQTTPPADAPRDTTKSEASARPQRARRDTNRITQEELSSRAFRDAYEAVQSLRPMWLRVRGASSAARGVVPARVYQNGMPAGDNPEALRNIRIESIASIEYLRAADATTRFGDDNQGGAILVTLLGTN
ncbi:MAG TPA: Plug domain-containing protein [Longimicrobium sp.]|nr:Plug domain-containing protein [Longimicrobium sp.]